MIYKLYKLNNFGDVVLYETPILDENIVKSLNIIEEEIISEYLNKQKHRVGISTLGNEIRFNKKLGEHFNVPIANNIIIKMTENRRSFFKVFLDTINDYKYLNIYFFVLERNFGSDSNLVDKSFPCINDVKHNLKLLLNNFKPTTNLSISVIEMCDFNDYFVQKYEGYTSIILKNIENVKGI